MAQYCRYCLWLCTGNGIWCDKKLEEKTESYAKHPNHCKDYEFVGGNPELQDAFMENARGYKPSFSEKRNTALLHDGFTKPKSRIM